MPKTRTDVIQMALRRLGVLASDTDASADDSAHTGETLDGIFEELQNTQGITITWTLNETPDSAFLPLSYLLATEVAPHFTIPAPESRAQAMGRVRAALIPDDREDDRDLDEDGTVTDAEIEVGKRAQFY